MRAQFERRFRGRLAFRIAILLSFLGWFVLPAYAVFPHHDGVHKEIEELESQWRDAMLTNNVAAMERLLADDYLGISANGILETKADILATRRSGAVKLTQMELSDVKIRVYGDTAVVTSKVDVSGTSNGRDVSGHYRYTRVYNYRNGQWQIISFEASRMPAGTERADKR